MAREGELGDVDLVAGRVQPKLVLELALIELAYLRRARPPALLVIGRRVIVYEQNLLLLLLLLSYT